MEGNTLTLSEEQWAALPKEQTLLWRVATWSEEGEGLSTVRRLHPAVETSLVTVPEGANIFSPAHIVVDVGTTVTFWNDPVSAGNLQNEIHDIQLYSASGSVVSPMSDVDGGGAFTWTFDEPGVWSSVCHRHSGVPGGIESLMAPRVEGAFKCMAATVTVR